MSKNIVKDYVEFTKDNFFDFSKKIMGKYFDKELFLQYMDVYINIRYYNQMDVVKSSMEANLNYYLDLVYSKNKTVVSKFMLELIKMYYYIDDVKRFDYNKDLKNYALEIYLIREEKVGIKDKDFLNQFKKEVKSMYDRKVKYMSCLDTNDFYLDLLDVHDNRYYVDIKTNVSIPKLYSGYAIRRVWNSNVISENTMQIELILLSQVILRDIIDGKFTDNYLVDFRCSLFSKKEKIKRVIDIVRNDICLDLISFNISYHDFLENKDKVLEFIKSGINFNIILDDEFLKNKNYSLLDVFKYIIITDSKYKVGKVSGKKNIVLM